MGIILFFILHSFMKANATMPRIPEKCEFDNASRVNICNNLLMVLENQKKLYIATVLKCNNCKIQ